MHGSGGPATRTWMRCNTDLDAAHQPKVYMRAGGLVVSEHCGKERNQHARWMGDSSPLFPRAVRVAGGQWTLHGEAGDLGHDPAGGAGGPVGVKPDGFSGVCARRGGATTAIEAGALGARARAVDAVGPRAGQGGAAVRGAERHEPGLAVPDVSGLQLVTSSSGSGWWRLLGDSRVPADRRILAGFVIWGLFLGVRDQEAANAGVASAPGFRQRRGFGGSTAQPSGGHGPAQRARRGRRAPGGAHSLL